MSEAVLASAGGVLPVSLGVLGATLALYQRRTGRQLRLEAPLASVSRASTLELEPLKERLPRVHVSGPDLGC